MDIRDVSIIDAMPVYDCPNVVLNVGCGKGRIDKVLSDMGYIVYATDYESCPEWNNEPGLKFSPANIFDLKTFPVKNAPIVICSEVLEHLIEYNQAFENLLALTRIRLIITVPFERSFFKKSKTPPPIGHCNFWSDEPTDNFKGIKEFYDMASPYAVSISKIRTKPRDVEMKQWGYLIVVDKRQHYG